MAVFWVVVPCSLVEVYQRFRGPCCLHHQGDRQTTRRYNPEDSHLYTHRRENLKSYLRFSPCSQQPATVPYPEPDESNPHSQTLFNLVKSTNCAAPRFADFSIVLIFPLNSKIFLSTTKQNVPLLNYFVNSAFSGKLSNKQFLTIK
jgi:hypothetical protein